MKETNSLRQLSIDQITSQAWCLTKKHLPIFLLLLILMQVVGGVPQSVYYTDYMKAIMENGTVMTEQEWLEMADPATLVSTVIYTLMAAIACWFIQMYLYIVTFRLMSDTAEGHKPDLTARLKDGLRGYWFFLGCYFVYGLLACIGFIACLLPGIILGIRWMFVPLIAALHPERTLSECFSQSWEMTKGHFWKLLLMGIIVVLLNILGLICCCVGIFVTSIISYFMYILAYRTLADEPEESVEDFTSKNLTIIKE